MRRVYRGRRNALLEALDRGHSIAAGDARPKRGRPYLRIVFARGPGRGGRARRAADLGVGVYPAGPLLRPLIAGPGLILGYAALDEEGIAEGVRRLRLAVDDVRGDEPLSSPSSRTSSKALGRESYDLTDVGGEPFDDLDAGQRAQDGRRRQHLARPAAAAEDDALPFHHSRVHPDRQSAGRPNTVTPPIPCR